MKSNKLAFAAIAVVLALWASNAKAAPELPFQFEKLNFSLVTMQQEVGDSGPNVLPNIETSKITSKDLLEYLATALNTNWPAGAQLALRKMVAPSGLGYDPIPIYIGDIFVVDKTGTNPVFDVSTGINVGDSNVVFFSYDSDGFVYSLNYETHYKGPSSSVETQFGKIFFHLFNERNGVTNTDLYFDGLNTIESHSTPIITTNKTIVYKTINEKAPVTGDGTFNDEWTVVKGKVTGSAKREFVPLPPPILFTNIIPFTNIFSPRTNIILIPTNRPPILFTNWPVPMPFTNILTFTNNGSPQGFHLITNPPPILLYP